MHSNLTVFLSFMPQFHALVNDTAENNLNNFIGPFIHPSFLFVYLVEKALLDPGNFPWSCPKFFHPPFHFLQTIDIWHMSCIRNYNFYTVFVK